MSQWKVKCTGDQRTSQHVEIVALTLTDTQLHLSTKQIQIEKLLCSDVLFLTFYH